ncbi:response regulator [Clostridium sp.]|uniref:response regulator transcription factor n=1 Tax=Clostridium sp. TaxID=1506 RepID=UPI003463B402
MIKVVFVDDEYFAREGMKKTIDWKSLNCEFLEAFDNPNDAIEECKILKPDLIITDINMPSMSGLEMAEKISAFLPYCKFIIITGYDEFEYAKQAIKLKAMDFLLKPLDQDELISSIKNSVKAIHKLKFESSIAKERILLDAMRGKISNKDSMISILSSNNINIRDMIIVNIENDNYSKILEEGREEEIYTHNRFIREACYKEFNMECFVVECHQDRLALIINVSTNFALLHNKLNYMQKNLINNHNIHITMGVSNINTLYDIKECYDESKLALKEKLYLGKGNIIYFKDINSINSIDINGYHILIKKHEEIILLIKAKDKVKLEKKLKDLYFNIFKTYKIEEHIINQITLNLIFRIKTMLKSYNLNTDFLIERETNMFKEDSKLQTIDEAFSSVHSICIDSIRLLKETYIESEDTTISKAIDYIKDNYNKDLSLSNVAKHAYLSESYLSRKIKQTLGVGFSEYVNSLRIEKSIELLRDPNLKVSEIALMVGYSDYRYFSNIFKKYTGYSPKEFTKNKT